MHEIVPYTCPRCEYKSPRKNDMRKHLNGKKGCPQIYKVLELTDAVKAYILANKIYRDPVAPIATNIQNINNYNQVINFVSESSCAKTILSA